MIRVRGLNKTYKQGEAEVKALKDVSLDIDDGEFLGVIGRSGSGKSTLLHMLGALDRPDTGEIFYDDSDILKMNGKETVLFRRKNIGFVFQSYNLIPELNAEQNIKFPAMLSKTPVEKEYFDMLAEKLEIVDRLSHLPSELSGGQMQRVAIARAFISKPKVILCDEPTGNLDLETSESVMSLIVSLKKELSQTVVLVTHDMSYAELADRVIRLEDGMIAGDEK